MGRTVVTGQAWILPISATDFVPVTSDVLSYEHDGALHLAKPLGYVTADGLTRDLQPYLDVTRDHALRVAADADVPLRLLLGEQDPLPDD